MSIEALAQRAGIDLEYTDAFGRRVVVGRDVLVALLRGLRYDARTDDDAGVELDRLTERGSRRFADVYVCDEGTPLAHAVPATRDGRYELHDEFGNAVDDLVSFGYYELFNENGERSRLLVAPAMAYRCDALREGRAWGIGAQLYSLRGAHTQGIGDFGALRDLVEAAAASGAACVGVNPLHELALDDPKFGSPYSPRSRVTLNPMYVDVYAAAAFLEVPFDRSAPQEHALVDYAAVAHWKRSAFETLFVAFPTSPRYAGHEHLDLHAFTQWLAELQLSQAARAGAGMPVGLYRDLAVGVGRDSDDVRGDPLLYATDLSIGAPPDPLNEFGQNWDLPPLDPRVLRERGYEPFAALLRANMRHAGALRIDHVMSLARLYCVPQGFLTGAYLRYDFDAMLAVLKIESVRARCSIVGEDLGTVPPGFRERLHANGIFTCGVLTFAHDERGFALPEEFAEESVVSTGTHDLPPLAGYVHGDDIATRERLQWLSAEHAAAEREARAQTVQHLQRALHQAGVVAGPIQDDAAWLEGVYAYLARTPARLVLVQLEDLVGARESVNVPGTLEQEPNWRRRLPGDIDEVAASERWSTIEAIMRRAGRASQEDM